MPVRTFAFPAAAMLGVLVACRDALGPRAVHLVNLSFATNAGSGTGEVAGATMNGGLAVAVGTDELVITRAQIVLREIEFEYEDSLPGCSSSYDDDICEKIEIGPVLVDLPLNGSLRTQITATVPAGTFDEIEFELEHAHDDSASERAFRREHPEFNGLSVRVEGTFNGQPFTFVSSVRAELEMEFDPPLVVGESGHNVTVSVDLARWFRRTDGTIIDPRTANPGGANAGVVAANIRSSFDAFGDDDRDGRRRGRGGDDDSDDDNSGRGS